MLEERGQEISREATIARCKSAKNHNKKENENCTVKQIIVQEIERVIGDALDTEKEEKKEIKGVMNDLIKILLGDYVRKHKYLEENA